MGTASSTGCKSCRPLQSESGGCYGFLLRCVPTGAAPGLRLVQSFSLNDNLCFLMAMAQRSGCQSCETLKCESGTACLAESTAQDAGS